MKLPRIVVFGILLIGFALFSAKTIPISSDSNIVATIVQKTASPGYAGNTRFIICDVEGKKFRVRFDWNEKTEIGREVRLLRLNKFLFPPEYVVDFNQALKPSTAPPSTG